MSSYEYRISHLNMRSRSDKKSLCDFLKSQQLSFDSDLEYVVAITRDEQIVASGALAGKVLKCIAVTKEYQGLGLTNRIVTDLISYQYAKGRLNNFIFTHPANFSLFKQLNFNEVITLDNEVVLLESQPHGIDSYLEMLKLLKHQGPDIGAIVVNSNPFTFGHRYLIEKAAKECNFVHLFVVEENKSIFSFDTRYNLVARGVKDLSNVQVHRAGDYIISQATFPSYFFKDTKKIVTTHAWIDLKIFAEKIAPNLGICKRYIGHEPFCPVTNHYNSVMKEYLPTMGIDVIEIKRMENNGNPVSASRVRKLFAEERYDELRRLVPEITYKFLLSKEGQAIRKKIGGK